MKVLLYIKIQFKLILSFILFVVIPYILFLKFSPYQVEGILYFALIFLLILKFSYFDNSVYKKRIEDVAKKKLQKQLNRVPSKNEIVVRVNDYANSRDFALGLTALLIILANGIINLI